MGENEDVITLLDEDGAEHEFSIVDVLEVGARRYAILQPLGRLEGDEEQETAVIFRMEDDSLVTIEDDAEFEQVRQAFEADSHEESAGESAESLPEPSTEDHGTTSH